jgi:N-acyl-D-aspartate/D-glutamate deacylase
VPRAVDPPYTLRPRWGLISEAPNIESRATLLGTFVRERGALSIEEGVHKLTGQPAAAFGIAGRGSLQPGFAADIAVFDPATVDPGPLRRVWDFPADSDRLVADRPEGIVHVMVNGTVIRADGQPVDGTLDRFPGEPIAPARRTA